MYSCFVLKPCEITNLIYFFFVLGGHYPLLLEVDADEKEKMFMIISSLEHASNTCTAQSKCSLVVVKLAVVIIGSRGQTSS